MGIFSPVTHFISINMVTTQLQFMYSWGGVRVGLSQDSNTFNI